MKVTPTPGSVSGRRIDRVGDPLEGLVNLFDLSLVLAVGLLLAALSSAGAVGILGAGGSGGTPIPGQPSGGQNASGQGTAVGTVYRLQDGTYVFAPQGTVKSGAGGATGTTGGTGAAPVTPSAGTGSIAPPSAGTGGLGSTAGGGSPGGGL